MNSAKSNSKDAHLFPELPPVADLSTTGGDARKLRSGFLLRLGRIAQFAGGVVTAAVRDVGQSLLRMPALEFTALMLVVALFLMSLY